MRMGLENAVVLVTGAASGIGLAIARTLCDEGVGALMLTDRNGPGLEAAAAALRGTDCGIVVADLEEAAAPAAIIAAVQARFGRIDGLANAAGLTSRGTFLTTSPELFDRLFAVNSRAAFFLMQGAIEDMLRRKAPGSIVNIQSMNAHCGNPDLAAYSGSKAALAVFTRNAANAHMADRIRVNGINLGWVDTEGERQMQAITLGRGAGWIDEVSAQMPLGRLIVPEEAARLAVFLLGAASVPMSGSVVDFEQRVAGAT